MTLLRNSLRRSAFASRFVLPLMLLTCLPAFAIGNGPTITNAQLSSNSIPAAGGSLTITANVTDAASPIASVTAVIAAANGLTIDTIGLSATDANGNYSGSDTLPANAHLSTAFTVTLTAFDKAGNSATAIAGTINQPSSNNTAVVFQNQSTGAITAWAYPNLNDRVYITHSLDTNWKVVAFDDFNGDGQNDLLLQNQSTGVIICWFLNGGNILSRQYGPRLPSADWKVVGTGSFNNDGQTDLLLENKKTSMVVVWHLNGLVRTGGDYVGSIPAGWNIVGVADFDGNGSPDILLQNPTTASIVVYLLSGTSVIGRQYIYPTPATGSGRVSPNWHVVGAVTLGGGLTVIGFENEATGAAAAWELYQGSLFNTFYLLHGLDPNWKVAAIPTKNF